MIIINTVTVKIKYQMTVLPNLAREVYKDVNCFVSGSELTPSANPTDRTQLINPRLKMFVVNEPLSGIGISFLARKIVVI